MAINYRKTKTGEWVAFGPVAEVHVGIVTVTKSSGERKTETVERLGKPFKVGGVDHVYGYLTQRRSNGGGLGRTSGTSGDGRQCDECGAPLRGQGTKCYDSSGIPGVCCRRCASAPRWERSFA